MLGFTGPDDFPDTIAAWEERIHPADHKRVMDKFYAAAHDMSNDTKYMVEYRARSKDGVYHWFRESAEVNRRLDGSPSRMTGIFINIDEEHRTREENEKYSAFHRAYSKSNLCEYYVDLQEDTFENFKVNRTLFQEYGSITSWDELAGVYVDSHVGAESREAIRLLFDRNYLRSELKKVVWPSGKQLLNNTLVVLASVLVVGIIVCVFDWLAGGGMSLLRGLFS